MQILKTNRREFLKTTGVLSIGFSLFGGSCLSSPDNNKILGSSQRPEEEQVNAWLRILTDGKVEVITGKIEIGQGILTAIKQVAAEELSCKIDQIHIHMAETGYTPNEGYTAGSRSIESSAMSVRYAAATAREILLERAAQQLGVNSDQLKLSNGEVSGASEKINIEDLLDGHQLNEKINRQAPIYAKNKREIVGRPIPREDIEKMVKAELTYVHDLRFDGMVHARVVRPPAYSAELKELDEKSLGNSPSLLKVVKRGSFLAVVCDDEYQAIKLKTQAEKQAKWSRKKSLPVEKPLKEHLKTLETDSQTDIDKGNWKSAMDSMDIKHKASYFKPYIMHGANGPSCALALFENDKLTVWTHSQGVYPLRSSLAAMLKFSEDQIHVIGVQGSGCYGHNGADDVAAEAALIAIEMPGRHVRLQWSREDEHGWEPYGTAMIMELQAGLDEQGKIKSWKYDVWSDGHSTRPGGNADALLPARYLDKGFGIPGSGFRGGAVRNAPPLYNIENLNIRSHIFSGPLRKSALRSLGAYANIFAIECFMDELAEKAGKDPIEFRKSHMNDERALECLSRLRNNIGVVSLKEHEGIGYGFSRYKNSAAYCSVAAHLRVNPDTKKIELIKMWGVIDAGEVINSDGLKNQTEGGMLQSASWALYEQVSFNQKHITSLDWNSYPVIRMRNIPEVEVEVIDRVDKPPLGAGEAAQGPATAAIANAIYSAIKVRVRSLPVLL